MREILPEVGDSRDQWQCTEVDKKKQRARWERNRCSSYIVEDAAQKLFVIESVLNPRMQDTKQRWKLAVSAALQLNTMQINEAKRILNDYDYVD